MKISIYLRHVVTMWVLFSLIEKIFWLKIIGHSNYGTFLNLKDYLFNICCIAKKPHALSSLAFLLNM